VAFYFINIILPESTVFKTILLRSEVQGHIKYNEVHIFFTRLNLKSNLDINDPKWGKVDPTVAEQMQSEWLYAVQTQTVRHQCFHCTVNMR